MIDPLYVVARAALLDALDAIHLLERINLRRDLLEPSETWHVPH